MRVLVGVDDSDRGLEALDEALREASEAEMALTVLTYSGENGAVERKVRNRLASADIEATVERADGDPGAALVDRAETGDYDRVVLPGGTRSPLGKIQFDSTVEFVLLNAHTSITLVR
jgi:nucleotide-binding universal stress UspA family protein